MIIVNTTKNNVLADQCRVANTFWRRLIGLLNRKMVAAGEGLLLEHCSGVHTFGMRFPIDIVCLGTDLRVLRIIKEFPQFRACVLKNAAFVIELPAGTIDRTQTTSGDQIQIQDGGAFTVKSERISRTPP